MLQNSHLEAAGKPASSRRVRVSKAARRPPEGVAGNRWRSLLRSYVKQLNLTGGMTAQQRRLVERCATLAVIAETTRARVAVCAASVRELDMSERALRAAERELRGAAVLPRQRAARQGPTLAQLIEGRRNG